MVEFLSSPLWSLFYTFLAICVLPRAYYSRHESIQKLLLAVLLANIATHVAFEFANTIPIFVLIDTAFLWYALYLNGKLKDRASDWIVIITVSQILTHGIGMFTDRLIHDIAYNALFVAQLTVLYRYGRIYGLEARKDDVNRNDPYYRFLAHFHGTG